MTTSARNSGARHFARFQLHFFDFGLVAPPESRAPLIYFRRATTPGCNGLVVHSFTEFNLRFPAYAAWFVKCADIETIGLRAQMS